MICVGDNLVINHLIWLLINDSHKDIVNPKTSELKQVLRKER
jgi:hypothetical protein